MTALASTYVLTFPSPPVLSLQKRSPAISTSCQEVLPDNNRPGSSKTLCDQRGTT